MKPLQDTYPVFEVNQVLTNSHLNEMFNYLDEQERLTRANLIGIGIVCGLEIKRIPGPPPSIQLTRGCGVTSEGYLIVEPEDVVLTSYREYRLPKDLDYPLFKDKSTDLKAQYPLSELFPAGEPNTTPLGTPADFLSDKAVLLFLELKMEGLRNCSPNECDDKGFKVTATLRRLLVNLTDLKKIIAEANQLDTGLTVSDLEAVLTARLDLPDHRLPRYDVPNTGPATSNEVLAAFHAVFHTSTLVSNTEKALNAAYDAFKPIVQRIYPSNPFTNFSAKFGFLDKAPTTTAQVRFLPYYYDLFDDILKAYNEFRWKGVELLCACCPPEGLFPRHLMLGVLDPDSVDNPGVYRHHFIASSAVSDCEVRTKEVVLLFQRLVEMIARFTNTPPLPQLSAISKTDLQIRITPSKLDDVPLSEKAIPYYYELRDDKPDGSEDDTLSLYHFWNFEKTRRNRANQNLSYRSDAYVPKAPAFVTDPLRYDLAPYNFLRIEGHLGKSFRNVLGTLLFYKTHYRLPIEIMALRTGAFDETIPVDLSKETCRFQDLETLYDALREELLSILCEGVMYFYDIPIAKSALVGGTPQLPLLQKYAPIFRYKNGTVGAWYEKYLASLQSRPYIDVDQNKIDNNAVLTVYCLLFTGTSDLLPENFAHVVSIYYLTKLAEVLPDSLDALGYKDFENKYQDLLGLIRYFRSDAATKISDEFKPFVPQEDLIDHFDQVLFSCKLEPVKAIHEEYVRRLREVKQKQFLGFFLQKNPGIQHKAGVPLGGTFIIVYHDEPEPTLTDRGIDFDEIREKIRTTSTDGTTKVDSAAIADAFKRISDNREFADDPDIRYLLGTFTGKVPDLVQPPVGGEEADKIIQAAIKEFADGTVIADFFLPYLCCSECAPVQYVLPAPPLGLLVKLGCTSPNGSAEVKLTPQGGMPPFSYQLDNQPFRELTGKPLLTVGSHTIVIRDSAGAESASQSLTVPRPLTIGAEEYTDDVSAGTYQVSFNISGGTAPYTADSGTLAGNVYTSEPVESEKPIRVKIADNVGCKKTSKEFQHTVCTLPCNGIAVRCGYRFWIPEPDVDQKKVFKSYSAKVGAFKFEFPEGNSVDLFSEVDSIIQADVKDLNDKFNDVIQSWLEKINKLIAEKTGSNDWLRLDYSKLPTDSVGTLWIEHFECLEFEFHIRSEFKRPEILDLLDMVYTPKGTFIENLKTNVPAFNCSQINKCDPKRPIVDRCKEVDLTLKISKKLADNKKVSLDVTPSGNDQPVAYLWEVQDGIPALSNKKKDTFTFELLVPTTKIIQLTAYTAKGCRVIEIDKIELKPPLGLSVELDCTDPKGIAEASLTPQGGMAPFTYQLDSQPFKELTGKLVLSVGPHTLVIRDGAGAESALQSLNVPQPLTIGAEVYDDVSATTYTVSFTISGGTFPYASDSSGTVSNDRYTSAPLENGKSITVEITDNAGCKKISKEFQHTVCTLPCKGIAVRCGYRFWIPEPAVDQKKVFTGYNAKAAMFMFEFPQGNSVDISTDIEKIIQAKPEDLNNKFGDEIQSWLEEINQLIAEKTGSDDWLRLDYSKLPTDSVGTLWIEHFECLKFEFSIQSSFQLKDQKPEKFNILYTPEGTEIQFDDSGSIRIPAFNCSQINKCDPKRPIVDRCKEVDLTLKISKKLTDNKTVSLDVTPSGNDQPVAYLWEVQDGIPALSNKKKDTFTFELLVPTTKIIQLTAYTAKGCRVIEIDKIELKTG